MDLGGWTDVGLKDAKMQAVKEAAAVLDRKLPELKWH